MAIASKPAHSLLIFIFIVFSLSKSFAQVNLQTGSATFSLPMFNWQDDKSRLNTIVALDYNSGSGLKTNSVASNIGQGWNLIAGGVITRMQVGEPDDQKPREGALNDVTKYPPGYLYNSVSPSLGSPVALNKYPIYRDKNQIYKQHNAVAADRELDYFYFQFNGRSGTFILKKDATDGVFEGVLLGDSKLKITYAKNETAATWGFRTTIHTFTIRDENGLIYRFGNINNSSDNNKFLGRTKILKSNYCNSQLSQQLTQPKFENGKVYYESAFDDNTLVNPNVVDGWFLAEIEDALTGRKVTLNYIPKNINASVGTDIAHYFSNKDYAMLSHKVSKTVTPVITSIQLPDGHLVSYNYGKARIDVPDESILSSIDITYNGRYLSKYELNTSYFILNRYGNPLSEYQKRVGRLCLLSVKKYGVDLKDSESPYNFDYYMGSNTADDFVPPPFFYAKDIWGYYNGSNSIGANSAAIPLNASVFDLNYNSLKGLCFIRNGTENNVFNAKPGYAKNGLLKQIIYPAGGSLRYEYAQNTGLLNGQTNNVGGVHVSKTSTTDGGFSNSCSNPLVTNYNYVLENSSQSSLWGLELPLNYTTVTNHYEPESKYYYWKPSLGSCAYRFQYPGILAKEQAVSLTNGQQRWVAASKVLNVVSVITTISDVANVIGGSTGFMAWASVVVDFIGNVLEIVLTCFSNPSQDNQTMICYNSDLKSVNPLPTQFKRVEIVQSTGTAGKTVQEFTSSDDYAIWELTNPAFSMRQRFAPWAYGLPKKITHFDALGNKVSEVTNVYDTTFIKTCFTHSGPGHIWVNSYPSCKSLVKKSASQRNTSWETPDLISSTAYITASNADVEVAIYNMCTGRMPLTDSYERTYKPGNQAQFSETLTHYDYHEPAAIANNLQPIRITTTKSNGHVVKKEIKYSNDYSSGVLLTLKQNNIIADVISTANYISKNSGPWLMLDETVTEFGTLSNGQIKSYRTLQKRLAQPQTPYSTYGGPGSDVNAYKEIQTFTYDAASSLVGMKDEGNHTVSNIYDYSDKFVVASVINAETITDKPAYTSFETTAFGKWTINGAANYVTTSAVTGSRSIALGTSNLSAQLNTLKPYKLSFWATNSNIAVNSGAILVKNAPIINGFTYYEYDVPQGVSILTVSGNATLDELRLYPKMARMRTVSYDPLVGKTSECDENNRITYYEYDELARLRFIKDENRHMVKMYEYNTKNGQTGCPATYTNLTIAEVFTKN